MTVNIHGVNITNYRSVQRRCRQLGWQCDATLDEAVLWYIECSDVRDVDWSFDTKSRGVKYSIDFELRRPAVWEEDDDGEWTQTRPEYYRVEINKSV